MVRFLLSAFFNYHLLILIYRMSVMLKPQINPPRDADGFLVYFEKTCDSLLLC